MPTDVFTPRKEEEEREEDLVVEEKESPRSQELASGLLESPALKFITRKDLYTFLSSAGVRGIRMGRGGCGERDVHGEGRVWGEGCAWGGEGVGRGMYMGRGVGRGMHVGRGGVGRGMHIGVGEGSVLVITPYIHNWSSSSWVTACHTHW